MIKEMKITEIQRKISRAGILIAYAKQDSKVRLLRILKTYCDILNNLQGAIDLKRNKKTR